MKTIAKLKNILRYLWNNEPDLKCDYNAIDNELVELGGLKIEKFKLSVLLNSVQLHGIDLIKEESLLETVCIYLKLQIKDQWWHADCSCSICTIIKSIEDMT